MKNHPVKKLLPFLAIALATGCQPHPEQAPSALFTRISEKQSHVNYKSAFARDPDDITGFLTGAGVSIADVNNDALPDIVFAGGKDSTRLYLNKGGFVFEDITARSGIFNASDKGRTDAAFFVDINGDGWVDIYLLKYGIQGNAEGTVFSDYGGNLLFINQKNLTFREQSKEYGLNVIGFKTGANFFDFDNDGDLDVIFINNPDPGNAFDFNYYKASRLKVFNNRLFENTGNHFEDITEKAGILNERCVGQSVSVADVNNDGWLDIYIANDFFGKDYLYINNGNKTFTDRQNELLPKTTLSSMGSDFADINGDGWLDLFSGEMLPEDAVRRKMNVVPFSNEIYSYMEAHRMAQYPRNMLQLNMSGHGFRDIGCLAGVEATEWSWGCLFADFDNDGSDDLFVANGIRRDITNMDFVKTNYGDNYSLMADPDYRVRKRELLDALPSLKTPNYIFKNNGNLTFSNMNKQWGFEEPVHSRGVAYADLDNDGDLDLVINNIDTVAFIYENHEEKFFKRNFLKVRLEGARQNTFGFGGKVCVYAKGKMQVKQLSLARGFMSSPEPLLHFGLDTVSIIDSVKVIWPGGKTQALLHVKANQLLTFKEQDAAHPASPENQRSASALLKDVTVFLFEKPVVHRDSGLNEFKSYRLFHRVFSKEFPVIAVADFNSDGREDFFILNAYDDRKPQTYLQQSDGKFRLSGMQSTANQLGNFSKHLTCMAPCDFDMDGDLDWFINDRIDYNNYPKPPGNYLLKNNHGTLEDVTDSLAPGLRKCGMVTSACWTDMNSDKQVDLVVVGEWMPVTIFKNEAGRFLKASEKNGLENATGWWNSVASADFDKDGDMDLIAGNLGLNSFFRASQQEPVTIYAADFDMNGTNDPIVFHYISGKNVPFVNRDLFCEQMPSYNNKFYTFENYAKATMDDIITAEQREKSFKLQANTMSTSYIENSGNGNFSIRALPNEAQLAPVNGIQAFDVNHDGNSDIVLCGNSFSNHYEYGNYDALGGLILLGDGKGNFAAMPRGESGFTVTGDAKNVVRIWEKHGNSYLFAVPQNNDTLKFFRLNTPVAQ